VVICVAVLWPVAASYGLQLSTEFEAWMKVHEKTYGTYEEFVHRRSFFALNKFRIEEHNAKNLSYKLGLNQFSDMGFEEFSEKYLMEEQHCSAAHSDGKLKDDNLIYLPAAVDWRKKGIVSPVKNQGHCGSCWAFSTTGCMEAHVAMATGKMLSLSEQQLIDCAQAFDNHGCSGGLPSHAFEYIYYNQGLEMDEDYPYNAKQSDQCTFKEVKAAAFVKEIRNITERDETGLQDAVARYGPVSIAFQVASDFHQYKDGVYDSAVCKNGPQDINHAVLAVGYDATEAGVPYWIVKNSWGTEWGIDGYFHIVRGKNMCGLADCASFPVVEKH